LFGDREFAKKVFEGILAIAFVGVVSLIFFFL